MNDLLKKIEVGQQRKKMTKLIITTVRFLPSFSPTQHTHVGQLTKG